jgi:hypothetical protein
MTRSIDVLARAVRLAAGLAVAGLLAGCTIASKTPLVGPDEGATAVLPATFYMFGYDEKDGSMTRNAEAPIAFTLNGHTYQSADKSLNVQFVPVAGTSDSYLVALSGPDSYIYGIGRYRHSLLAVNIVLADSDPGQALEAEKASGAPGADALAGVAVEDGAFNVTTRAALDYLVRMNLSGKLAMSPVVAYVAGSEDAPAPRSLVPEGDFYRAQ